MKVPVVGKVSASIKKTWTDTAEDTSEDYEYTKNEFAFNAATTTGFGDQIWYSENSFNLYLYPVLGQSVCPNDNPDCSPEEEEPLWVQFSGPNTTGVVSASGATIEWYQPVHEPGQVFSYPWNQSQLEARIRDLSLLSSSLQFFSDDSKTTQTVQWSMGSGSSLSTGTASTHSYDTQYSASLGLAGKVYKVGFNADISGTFDYNTSDATSTLNTSTSDIGASAGVEIAKPGSFLDPELYQYKIEPFIFGQAPPEGTVDSISQDQPVQTTGALQTAFAADPTASGAGSWWFSDENPYRQFIDVALNHPARWVKSNILSRSGDLSCLQAAESTYNCLGIRDASLNSSEELWNNPFYWMRGLLVTVGSPSGPQRNYATEGDDVWLQARVYNYSQMDMPYQSEIKLRFYRQEITGTTPAGDAVMISEESVDPLPGFNSIDAPNWSTVNTSFNTSGLADKHYIFWVVVWLEDGAGNMISELDGHGLAEKPGTLNAIGDVALEEKIITDVNGNPKTVSFSNNVGFLKQAFYVAPETAEPLGSQPDPELHVLNIDVTPKQVQVGEEVIVSADIFSANAASDHVVVRFYDGEVGDGVEVFDMEAMPHIRADESWRVSVPFRPMTCGTYQITISARLGAISEAWESTQLEVPCALEVERIHGEAKLDGKRDRMHLKGRFISERSIDLEVAQITIESVLKEAGAAGELVEGVTGLVLKPRRDHKWFAHKWFGHKGSKNVVFENDCEDSPRVRLRLVDVGQGRLKAILKVSDADIAQPALCGGSPATTNLQTRLIIDDGLGEPVAISTTQPWQCKSKDGSVRRLHLRQSSHSSCD